MTLKHDNDFETISKFIEANYGIKLGNEKKALLTGRLKNTMMQLNIESFSDYVEQILNDKSGKMASVFIDKITTNHTYFMRETEHFTYFKEKVLPFLEENVKEKDLRIWCAGCSSGEESYTLAMILEDYFLNNAMIWDKKVLATDISSQILEKAVAGIYSKDQISSLPINWKLSYFEKLDSDRYIVSERIKKEVIFRKFNLMQERFPFKRKFNVIFCRNVMIYFNNETRIKLVNKFYDLTETGGYLFIGHSESLGRDNTRFKYIMPAVYRKV